MTNINIHETLGQVQKSLSVPKGQYNNFGKYKYRSCEDILEALKKVLPEGASLVMRDDMVMVGERYYLKATATFRCGTEIVETSAYARESLDKKGMDDAQITGCASSYARKYALNGLFLIDESQMDLDSKDNSEAHKPPALVKVNPAFEVKILDATYERLIAIVEEVDPEYCTIGRWLQKAKVTCMADLKEGQGQVMIKHYSGLKEMKNVKV
jgi:hypothetical protein